MTAGDGDASATPALSPPAAAGAGIARWANRLALGLFAVAAAAAIIHFAQYLDYAWTCIRYPFELFDAEGIVWQQAMLIPGPRMYGDITRFPFVVFHYPPVYHLLIHGAAELGLDPLAAGRGISVLASLVTAGVIAVLAHGASGDDAGRPARLAGAMAGGLAFFCFYPVVAVSPLLRVDMVAIALSFMGVLCAWNPAGRRWAFHAAMVLFVLAVFTKQTTISAPAACLLVQAAVNLRTARQGFLLGLALGGVALAVLAWSTGGGFLRHLVFYNLNRYSIDVALWMLSALLPNLILLLLGLAGACTAWQRHRLGRAWHDPASLRRDLAVDPTTRLTAILAAYLALTTLSLVMIGKSGAGLNYFAEWMAVLSVFIGVLVARYIAALTRGPTRGNSRPAIIVLPALLLLQLWKIPAARSFDFHNQQQVRELAALAELIRHAPKPVLSDDMVLLLKAGKEVPWEPAIFRELATMGRWDENLITSMITRHDFAFVVSRGPESLTPGVADAVARAYPRKRETGGRIVHTQAGD